MSSRSAAINSILSVVGPPTSVLPEELVERILARLGFSDRPDPTPESLRAIYASWCRKVPFDNVRKLIHVRTGDSGPLPGNTATDFFSVWLQHGTGGTCWAGSDALHALLATLGFDVLRGIATMLVAPELPPNHGCTMVKFGDERFLVDSGMLHGAPLLLDRGRETGITHRAWGLQCSRKNGRWHINWRPLHKVDGFECRLEWFGAGEDEYRDYHDQTRGWSPFNYEVTARVNRGDEVKGLAFGNAVTLRADGSVSTTPVAHDERVRVLVEDIGLSEEIASRLPEDIATPPPPWSQSAQREPKIEKR
jgi:arylamine N-acetyltransferase